MDNFQKALYMGAAAFLFVMAASVSIVLYSSLIESSKNVMLASDASRNSAEYATVINGDFDRKIHKDEIIMTILDFEKNSSFIDTIKIVRNSNEYIYNNSTNDFKTWLQNSNDTDEYISSYIVNSIDGKGTLIYTLNNN